MTRSILAVLTGLAVFTALELALAQTAKAVWPAYAAAAPTWAFTLDMLIARQIAGVSIMVVAGAATTFVARGNLKTTLLFAALFLIAGVTLHVRTWAHYPVWYHLLFFAWIVPAALAGGRLVGRQVKMTNSSR
jgi:hypothetical protein